MEQHAAAKAKEEEVEKKEKEELDKIFDYYYEVVKPAINDPNKTEAEKDRILHEYHRMRAYKEAPIMARRERAKDEIARTISPPLSNNKRPPWQQTSSSPSSSGSGDIKAGILLVCFIGGFILIIVASVTANLYAGIFGLIMFGIGVGALFWAQGVQEAKYASGRHGSGHGSYNQWNDYYMTRWGSAKAKRNMWRGHKYSKK